MFRLRRTLLIATAVSLAVVVVLIVAALPPKRLVLVPFPDGTIPGILHVHTNRSDGLSSPDVIAAAAARAGLKFVVFTDHGDGTRPPDPPVYRSAVLCLDGVEISTNGGHYIALGMPRAPYPLAGEARDVVEDVRRLGGIGIAAHPDSPKPQLQWRDWSAPIDGVEVMNPDTAWRRWADEAAGDVPRSEWRARGRLAASLLTYLFRSPETIASLMLVEGRVGDEWMAQASQRRVFAIAGVDAHAKLSLRADPHESSYTLSLPGYEAIFRTMSVRAALDGPLSGDPAADGGALLDAIRGGRVYMAIDAIASPPSFEFTATNAGGTARQGDELTAAGPVTLRVRHNAPPSFTTIVRSAAGILDGSHQESTFTVQAPADPAMYWVEIRAPADAHQASWLRSNPIYIRGAAPTAPPVPPAPPQTVQPIFSGELDGWRVEHDSTSLAAVDVSPPENGSELRLRYGLSGGAVAGQVAALAFDTPAGIGAHDRLTFTIRADRPTRISVQFRSSAHERWQRSVYVDTVDQERTILFDDLTPLGRTNRAQPALTDIRTILFVVDVTNTAPGTSGRLWIKNAVLAH